MRKAHKGLLIIALPVEAHAAPKAMRAMTGKAMKKTPKVAKRK